MNKQNQIIIGRNSIAEIARFAPERLEEVVVAESERQGGRRDSLIDDLQAKGIKVSFARKEKLSELCGSDSHQGFLASLKPRVKLDLKPFLASIAEKERALIVLLDSIYDPHNLGAILRACECFGVDGVIYSKNRGAPITPVVSKVSVGASEIVPLVEVSNLVQAVERLHDAEFTVIAADAGPEAHDIRGCKSPQKVALVMGSEGEGVQPLLLKKCDFSIKIPMMGRIDSLNVSQATAVALYALCS